MGLVKRLESQWQRRGYDRLLMPLPHATMILLNGGVTSVLTLMLFASLDPTLNTLRVSSASLLVMATAVMTLLSLCIAGARFATQRRRACESPARQNAVLLNSATTPWRRTAVSVSKIGVITAFYVTSFGALRVVAAILLSGHFAGGDMSALLLVLPVIIGTTALLRATVLERRRSAQRVAAYAAPVTVEPRERVAKHGRLHASVVTTTTVAEREVFRLRELVYLSQTRLRAAALAVMTCGCVMVYYPATHDIPTFSTGVVTAMAFGLFVLTSAGVTFSVADALLETMTIAATRRDARAHKDRWFQVQVSASFLLWSGVLYAVMDIGGDATASFFAGFTSAHHLPLVPVLSLIFAAPSPQYAVVWYALMTTMIAVAVLTHIRIVVLMHTSVPMLVSFAVSMAVAYGTMLCAGTPPPPNAPSVVYYALGCALIAAAVYILRWNDEPLVTDACQRQALNRLSGGGGGGEAPDRELSFAGGHSEQRFDASKPVKSVQSAPPTPGVSTMQRMAIEANVARSNGVVTLHDFMALTTPPTPTGRPAAPSFGERLATASSAVSGVVSSVLDRFETAPPPPPSFDDSDSDSDDEQRRRDCESVRLDEQSMGAIGANGTDPQDWEFFRTLSASLGIR